MKLPFWNKLGQRSFITLQLYLSDNQEGATNFYETFPITKDEKPTVSILPRKGQVVLFDHRIFHEGCILVTEHKYALRTDVFYKKIH